MTYQPARTTFRFYRGATFSTEEIDVQDSDGVAVDLTNWTGVMRVWREDADPTTADPLFASNGTSPKITLLPSPFDATGKVTGVIGFADTLIDVDPDGETWYCRLELTNTNPNPDVVERTLEGYVIAFP